MNPETKTTNDDPILVRVGRGEGAKILNPGDQCVLGADPHCDLVVRDSSLSPRHCGLRHRGHAIEVWDCSRDGTVRFAGARVVRAMLPLEGCFEIGGRARVRLSRMATSRRMLLPDMVGSSPAMHEMARMIHRAASVDVHVLLRGESGSGKELAAKAVHHLSRRRHGPFVALNGATLSEALAPSALFGHVRGAFTGALEPRLGALRQADGGTLFIDEVGAIPGNSQALLLRALEDFAITPVGGDNCHTVDVRIVTATCEDIEVKVRTGHFRSDLYQRVGACVVRIPPLRQRREDVAELAQRALDEALPGARLAKGATQALDGYSFPGNVRELRNIVLQAAMDADTGLIVKDDLARVVRYRNGTGAPPVATRSDDELLALLAHFDGNISRAARQAGMARSTFRDRVVRAGALGGDGEGGR